MNAGHEDEQRQRRDRVEQPGADDQRRVERPAAAGQPAQRQREERARSAAAPRRGRGAGPPGRGPRCGGRGTRSCGGSTGCRSSSWTAGRSASSIAVSTSCARTVPSRAPSSSTITPRPARRGQRGVEGVAQGPGRRGDGAAAVHHLRLQVAVDPRRARPSPAAGRPASTSTQESVGGPADLRRRRADLDRRLLPQRQVGSGLEAAARGSRGRARRSRRRSRRPGGRAGRRARRAGRGVPPTRRTATWSPSLIASSMSWVTKRMVLPSSACRRRNSSCSCSRTIGSTALNGSSISITGGSAASARATPTRCCWPPESWAG